LQDAILERQKADRTPTAWDSGNPTSVGKQIGTYAQKSDYTLTQLKAYVSFIATSYLSGTYSGGASAPVMLTSSYADGAADCEELLALVAAMLTWVDGDHGGGAFWAGTGYDADFGTAKSDAIVAYSYAGSGDGPSAWAGGYKPYGVYIMTKDGNHTTLTVSDLETGIGHSCEWYGYCELPSDWDAFSKHGLSLPDQDTWGKIAADTAQTTSASITTGDILGSWSPSWPTESQSSGTSVPYKKGFDVSSMRALVTWAFTYV